VLKKIITDSVDDLHQQYNTKKAWSSDKNNKIRNY
jgi:hypothetical protein